MTEPRPRPPEQFNPVFDYDDRIPADLLARWTSLDPDRVVLLDLAGFLAIAAAALLAGVGLAGQVTGGLAGGLGILVCLFGLLVTVAASIMRRRWLRRNHLRGRDIDLILDHRQEIRFEPWNRLIGDGRCFDSWPDEPRLAHRAAREVRAIQATAVWSDANLLDHRLRIDLPENVRRIQVDTWHLHALRIEMGPRPAEEEPSQLVTGWQDVANHHAHSLQVLRQHVAALEDYRAAVDEVNHTLEIARRTAHLRHLTDRAVPRLATQDAHHELTTEHLDGLRNELVSFGGQASHQMLESSGGASPQPNPDARI